MTIAIEEAAEGSAVQSSATVAVTFAGIPADGELIILGLCRNDDQTNPGSDSSADTGTPPSGFAQAVQIINSLGDLGKTREASIYYKIASSEASATYTFTGFNTSNPNSKKTLHGVVASASASEFDNLQVEATNSAEDNGTPSSMASGDVVTTVADSLLVALVIQDIASGTWLSSWGSSFVEQTDVTIGGSGWDQGASAATRVVTSTGTYNTTATFDDAKDQALICIAAFNAGAAGGLSIPITIHHYKMCRGH